LQWLASLSKEDDYIVGTYGEGKSQVPGTSMFCEGRRGDTFFDFLYCGIHHCDRCNKGKPSDITFDAAGLSHARQKITFDLKGPTIESMGYSYVLERQCEFEAEIRACPDRAFAVWMASDMAAGAPRLDVRGCYSGGRVEPGALYYKCKPDEVLRSWDAVSLYPSVMTAQYEYPIGPPTVLRSHKGGDVEASFNECVSEQNIDKFFGLVRCKMISDRTRLHHPLIVRHNVGTPNEKLTSSACPKCAARVALKVCSHDDALSCADCEELGEETCKHVRCCSECQFLHLRAPCEHTDDERAFWVECTTEEIKCALREGDTLLKITEVHHFERRGNATSDFVYYWYRVKLAASGLPSKITSIEDTRAREAAIVAYLARLDADTEKKFSKKCDLRADEFCFNAGLRQVAKIMLNSFYGKFGTRPDKQGQAYVSTREQFDKLVQEHNHKMELSFIIRDADDPVSVMSFKNYYNNISITESTSVYVAIFVCAYGRLKLYNEALKPAGDKALYWDTDSCLRITKRSDLVPECDGFLGDWEHEPEKDSVEFASLGPKTYALALENGGCMSKCKGISKKVAAVTMDVGKFKEILLGETACIVSRQEQWKRTNEVVDGDRGFKVKIEKDFGRTTRFTASKRMPCAPEVDEEGKVVAIMTKPFGYKST
jgi:hypothetical protein